MSFDDPAFKPWIELFGRLHPTMVHFPIALLLVAALFEFARRRARESGPASFALWCLGIGAGMAAITATSGWARAASEPFGGDLKRTLFMHRWGGISVASIALIAFAFGLVARAGATWARAPYRAGLLALVLLVPGVGHLGATLVYGADWFTEPFTRGEAVESKPTPTTQTPTALTSIDFETQIAPIFAKSCIECHGPKKQKGNLAFVPIANAFKGDPNEWPIRPGNAAASPLVHRVSLPQGDEDAMPPGERARLTPQQIAMLTAWIDAGAPHPGAQPGQLESEAGAPGAAASDAPSAEALAARDAALAALVARGAYAARIAADSDQVEVNLSLLGAQVVDADLAHLHGLEPFLVSLDLSRTGVTDAVAPQLAAFTRIERLRLDHTAIGDAALPVLKLMPGLEYLNLVETKVTNAAIPLLGDLRALAKLYVWQSALTSEGVAALRQTRPQLEVVFGEIPAAPVAATASAPPAPAPTTAVPPPAKEKHCPCCDKAKADGKVCDHPCCVQAAKDGKMCETCAVDKP